jgi:hypothetical protein
MDDMDLASKIPNANPLHMLSNFSSTMLALPYHIKLSNMAFQINFNHGNEAPTL